MGTTQAAADAAGAASAAAVAVASAEAEAVTVASAEVEAVTVEAAEIEAVTVEAAEPAAVAATSAAAVTAAAPSLTPAGPPANRPGWRRGLIVAGVTVALLTAGAVVYPLMTTAAPTTPQALPSASQPAVPVAAGASLPAPAPSRSARPRRSASASPSAGTPSVSASATPGRKPSATPSTSAAKPATTPPTTAAAVTGTVFASIGTGTCLFAPASGGRIQSQQCRSSAPGQRFSVGANGTLLARGKCVQADGTSDGSGLRLATCDGRDAQRWDYNSAFDLVSLWGVKCVDIPDASTANGVAVQIWECTGASHQKWNHSE